MTQAELIQMAQQYSGYTGGEKEVSYTGLGDTEVDFGSKNQNGSFYNLNDEEPFSLQIVNAKNANRKFYLSQGLLYTRGSESAGQLRTGAFAAINDTGSDTSITASTSNPITIEQFIAYTRKNPTLIHRIDWTSTAANTQLSLRATVYRQYAIKNSEPKPILFRKYADGGQYNLQFQTLKDLIIISDDYLIEFEVAASSTLNLDIYIGASKSNTKGLENRVNAAAATAVKNPTLAKATQDAVSTTKLSSPMVIGR